MDQEVTQVQQREEEVEQEDNLHLFSPVSSSCLILPKLPRLLGLTHQRTPADHQDWGGGGVGGGLSTADSLQCVCRCAARTLINRRSLTVTKRPFQMCVWGLVFLRLSGSVRSLPPTWPLCRRTNGDDSLVLFRGSSHVKKKNISLEGATG